MSFFGQFSKKADQIIAQAGTSVDVLREVQGGTDRYGKPSTSWDKVGEATVVDFSSSRDTSLSSDRMGRYREDDPRIAFSLNADIQEDDRITLYDITYRVSTRKRLPSHYEARILRVTE